MVQASGNLLDLGAGDHPYRHGISLGTLADLADRTLHLGPDGDEDLVDRSLRFEELQNGSPPYDEIVAGRFSRTQCRLANAGLQGCLR
jgi:hypothetical protein